MNEEMYMALMTKISRAYWSNPALNESADRKAGEAFLGKMTIADLKLLTSYWAANPNSRCGPTYCLTYEYIDNLFHDFVGRHADAALSRVRENLVTLASEIDKLKGI